METAHELEVIRPWRRATIAVTLFAAVEFVVLAGVGMAFLGNPLANHFRASAARAGTPLHRDTTPVPAKKASLARNQVSVMVLNGGGVSGAAHAAADRVTATATSSASVGNARRRQPAHTDHVPPRLRRRRHSARTRPPRPDRAAARRDAPSRSCWERTSCSFWAGSRVDLTAGRVESTTRQGPGPKMLWSSVYA